MKKQQLLWLAIFFLFVLNMATIAFICFHSNATAPQRPGRETFDRLVMQTLQLNEAQRQQFNEMKRQHHEAMMQLDESMKEPIEQYFGLLLDKNNDTVTQHQLEQKMVTIYLQKLQITYRHFDQLKSICSPEQQKHFDQLIPQLMQVMQAPPPPGIQPPHPEEN